MTNTPACHCSKHREDEQKKKLLNRLSRIEGQLRGLSRMVEEDAYCIDILRQVSASRAALESFSHELLASHIRSCLIEDVREGRTDTVEELIGTLKQLL